MRKRSGEQRLFRIGLPVYRWLARGSVRRARRSLMYRLRGLTLTSTMNLLSLLLTVTLAHRLYGFTPMALLTAALPVAGGALSWIALSFFTSWFWAKRFRGAELLIAPMIYVAGCMAVAVIAAATVPPVETRGFQARGDGLWRAPLLPLLSLFVGVLVVALGQRRWRSAP